MSGRHGNWDDLSSGNERLVQATEPRAGSAQARAGAVQWAALGSQRERLADSSLLGQPVPASRSANLRLVASAA